MAKRYFEYIDDKSSKFWELSVTGKKIKVRYGKIDTISKCVISRLIQHVRGNTHFAATLAYRIANKGFKKEFPDKKLSREEAMEDPTFIDLFTSAKERIKGMDVIFVEIENPLELYIFEPYCAMKCKTATMECKADELNTFETH